MLVGICGKSGSGKSTLAKEFIKTHNNVVHLEIDKIGHKVLEYEDVKKRLIESFGMNILTNDIVDRKKLSKIVFDSKDKMDILTEITWTYMQVLIDQVIDCNKDKIIILDWLLLPKSKYFNKCFMKILLDTDYSIRMKRSIARDGISEEAFLLREKASLDYNYQEFDYIIKNNDIEKIKEVVNLI